MDGEESSVDFDGCMIYENIDDCELFGFAADFLPDSTNKLLAVEDMEMLLDSNIDVDVILSCKQIVDYHIKIDILSPIIETLNLTNQEDLICKLESICDEGILIYSRSCDFQYVGVKSIVVFFMLLFEKHCKLSAMVLSSFKNSTSSPVRGNKIYEPSLQNYGYIVRIDGRRFFPFYNFHMYRALMDSNLLQNVEMTHDQLKNVLQRYCAAHLVSFSCESIFSPQFVLQLIYVLEITLYFDDVTDKIVRWQIEILNVNTSNF